MKSCILSKQRSTHQNHRKMKIFSLRMFKASTQRASCFWIVPEAPNLWNVHLVSLGKTSIWKQEVLHQITVVESQICLVNDIHTQLNVTVIGTCLKVLDLPQGQFVVPGSCQRTSPHRYRKSRKHHRGMCPRRKCFRPEIIKVVC